MYKLQEKPDDLIVMRDGGWYKPLATLKNEYGGVNHIVENGHCYVLAHGNHNTGFIWATHWYAEAVEALKTLPSLVSEDR